MIWLDYRVFCEQKAWKFSGLGMLGAGVLAAVALADVGAAGPEIVYNPYGGVDWDAVSERKIELHLHAEDEFWDGPHHSVDWYAGAGRGDGPEGDRHEIGSGDAYSFIASSPGNRTYWAGESGWDFSRISDAFEDRDPEAMGVVAFPWMESKDTGEGDPLPYHFGIYFTNIPSTADIDNSTVEALLNSIRDWGGAHYPVPRVIWCHPGRHYEGTPGEEYEKYMKWFENRTREELWGMEVLNKTMMDPSDRSWRGGFEANRKYWDDPVLWDYVLTRGDHSGDRLPWGFGTDDASEPDYGRYLDRHWSSLLLADDEFDPGDQAGSRRTAVAAMDAGRFFSHRRALWWDRDDPAAAATPPMTPRITRIDVDGEAGTISIEVDPASYDHELKVEWISGVSDEVDTQYERGHVIATGDTVDLNRDWLPLHEDELTEVGGYVRAVVLNIEPDAGPGGKVHGETYTQPFTIRP